jgi:pimeloyl-ACP methyl ester carboxylesterase
MGRVGGPLVTDRPGGTGAVRTGLIALPWGRLYVRDRGPLTGSAPPLVLLHGFLRSGHSFRALHAELAGERRVLVPDLPGTGDSDRPPPRDVHGYGLEWLARAVIATLEAFDLPPVDLFGHSLGGAVALVAAAEAPDRVRRVIVEDTIGASGELPLEGRIALLPRLGPWVFQQLIGRAELRRHFARAASHPDLVDDEAVDVYWERLGRAGGREAAYALLQAMAAAEPLRSRLPQVRAPTLVIWGERDRLLPVRGGEALAAALPAARLQVIEGCGHAPHEDRPDRVLALIREFTGVGAIAPDRG